MKIYMQVLLLSIGGAAGANARYWISLWFYRNFNSDFPWGTFFVNISGSFVLGFAATFLGEKIFTPPDAALRHLLLVGFLGAYTTFSTFEYETLTLLESGAIVQAAANAFGSLLLGLFGVFSGVVLARSI